MGRVVLISGSPMTGKTTVAVELAVLLRCGCISTDDIGEVLQAVMPINPMRGRDYREYYAETAVEELTADIRQYHRAMEPAIERLIRNHGSWGNSIVIEGWALYPQWVEPLLGENVSALWLIAGEGLLERRLHARPHFLDGMAARHYLERSLWHNRLLQEECERLGLPWLVVEADDPDLTKKLLPLLD